NTASKQLLSYVSGLNSTVAANIVEHRNAHGAFKSRGDLLSVKGLGAKTFEQAAGFLRIRGGENPLDESAVHPERYALVSQMASDLNADVASLLKRPELRAKIDIKKYVSESVGLPTLKDIMAELGKPGRDPREKFEAFSFAEGVNEIDDLREGMRLPGIVTNVTAFGAFVDIGVHQDGLVHISELSDNFVRDPNDVVKPQQKVNVYVLEVDKARRRISLSMKSNPRKRAASAGDIARAGQRKPNSNRGGVGRPQHGGSINDAWTSAFNNIKFGR
ncbi:MAG: helix-hairpin-helix domain-containing protein, partial [Opitutales bacterium]|nr:helix-hairpin-helix domain-containing protein [Opitutales bacterium]